MPQSFMRFIAILPGLILTTHVWARFSLGAGTVIAPGFIGNPDAYVRLERIRQLMVDGGWFERVFQRVGMDDQLILHWTRPLDALVIVATWIAESFTTSPDPLMLAGTVISLPAAWIALYLASNLPSIAGEHRPMALGLTALFISLLPYFYFVFIAQGWPDHHGLLLILFILALLLGHNILDQDSKRSAWGLGFVQALAIWISPESLVSIGALHIGFGLLWAMGLNKNVSRLVLRSTIALALGVFAALWIEFGAISKLDLALDRLSLFSLALSLVLVGIWTSLYFLEKKVLTPVIRIFAGLITSAIAAALLIALVPQAVHGPMAHADTWFVNVWTGVFSDGFTLGVSFGLILCALSILIGVAMMIRSHGNNHVQLQASLAYITPSLVLFCLLSWASSERWITYAQLCAIPYLFAGFAKLWDHMSQRKNRIWVLIRPLSLFTILGLASLNTVIAQVMYLNPKWNTTIDVYDKMKNMRCDIPKTVVQLHVLEQDYGPQVILAHSNVTPTYLYHTNHRVLSVPIHPNADAVHDSVSALLSTEPDVPKDIAADVIVVCPVGPEMIAYQRNQETLHARLSLGRSVPGMTLLYDLGAYEAKIYAIEK
ncbi:MAG: hypothetical protein OQK24_04350 [Magnetovibrio sp.]|nr:hypothetical protein [Magnetovibrio sp.]